MVTQCLHGKLPETMTASSLAVEEYHRGQRSALMLLCGFLGKGSAQGFLPRNPGTHCSPETSDHIQPCLTVDSCLLATASGVFLTLPLTRVLSQSRASPCFSAAAMPRPRKRPSMSVVWLVPVVHPTSRWLRALHVWFFLPPMDLCRCHLDITSPLP